MPILIRAEDVPPGSRHESWRSVVCDTLGPLDCRIDSETPLRGEIESGRLGSLMVGGVRTSTPHSVHRTPGLIRRDGPEHYRVVLAVAGNPIIAQGGRETRLKEGEFAIYDFTRPYDLAYDSAVRLAVFSFPHDALALPRDVMGRLAAVPIASESGAGALAVPFLRRVAADAETYQPASATRLSAVALDLITTAAAERADQAAAPSTESLLLRIHTFIEKHLGDVDLDPGTVAAAHHISLRYLHRLFEAQDTTVAAWIRRRRLERCRQDLADPAMHRIPVSAVAARWGLPDAAHFSRVFRRTYGVPPLEYRRACA